MIYKIYYLMWVLSCRIVMVYLLYWNTELTYESNVLSLKVKKVGCEMIDSYKVVA